MVAAWYKEVKQTIAALNQKKKDLENRNRVEVADIILAFDHGQLIQLLKERGAAITALDFKRTEKINGKIKKLV